MIPIAPGGGPRVGFKFNQGDENDERAIADVAVSVLGNRLQQGRNRLRRSGAANQTRRRRPGVVIELAELVDRGLELSGGNGLRTGRLLTACGGATTKDTKDTKENPSTWFS